MNELQLVQSNHFGEIPADIYSDGDNTYMTINQLANCLGYSARRGVEMLVERNEYLKNPEFSVTHSMCATDGKYYATRIFTEDGIYEVSMLSGQPKAKEFRAWVRMVLKSIRQHGAYMTPDAIERVLQDPDTIIQLATLLKSEQEQRRALAVKVEADHPKVLFADAVTASKTSILVGELAKLLKQNGADVGQNRLFEWLRTNGYLISRNGTDYNMPTQRSMELGLFEIKETVIAHGDGHTSVTKTPKVTGKGQLYFTEKFLRTDLSVQKTLFTGGS